MKVTIAIPTHNRTKYLDAALACAAGQSFEGYEIVVGDSSDHENILEKVEPYLAEGKVRYLRLPPEMDLIAKFNTLLKSARGEWLVFLCDDDILHTDYLNVMMKHADEQPKATLIRCRFKIIDGEGHLLRVDPESKTVMTPAEFLSHLFLPEKRFFKMNISGILFRRQTLLEQGGFHEFPSSWHLDILALALVGSRGLSIFEKECLASIRLHPDSQATAFNEDLLKIMRTNLGVSGVLRRLFKRLNREVSASKDRKLLKIAERNSKKYMRRHLSRVFDHGILAALSTQRPGLHEYVDSLLGQMRQMGVPKFKSSWVYACLGRLAYPVRRPALEMFKRYKIKKWCS